MTLDATSFGNSWGEDQRTIAVAREVPALERDSTYLLSRTPAWLGTHWKFKMTLLEREETWNQTVKKGLGQRCKGNFESRKRADWQSVKGLTESDKSSSGCYTRQARAPRNGFQLWNGGNWFSWEKVSKGLHCIVWHTLQCHPSNEGRNKPIGPWICIWRKESSRFLA